MSADYPPGTVAVATVNGVTGQRVWRTSDEWCDLEGFGRVDAEVTDIRPLVVLDLNLHSIGDLIRHLRDGYWLNAADQIEAQTKPPRIPEPGLWGVVEASPRLGPPAMRRWVRYGTGWRDAFGGHSNWDDLIDPTLIREGVSDDA